MSDPLVSVVIPTYNRAQYIAETIESVLAQSYNNFEVIVIDDGSTDDTRDIVQPYVPRVRYVWQENSERGASRNHGLRLAKGDFVAFLDSDDLWLSDKLDKDVATLRANPDAGLICSDAIQIDSDGRRLRSLKANGFSGKVTTRLLSNNFVLLSTQVSVTRLIRDTGGFNEDRKLSGSEDWELWVRFSTKTKFIYEPSVTAKIRTHPNNTMTDPTAMERSMLAAVQLMEGSGYLTIEQKKTLSSTKAMVSLVNAINRCSAKQKGRALQSLRRSFSFDPRIVADPRFAYTFVRLVFGDRLARLGREGR